MRIVVGHANPDFDAYAATVAATRLFEGAKGVFLGTQNANVRAFHNLHEDFVPFVDLRGLDLSEVDSVIMVDTRDAGRIGEIGSLVARADVEVIVYDHHPPQEGDVSGVEDRSADVGATTSILVHELRARGIVPTPLEASLFLLGIHEDTGSLTYPTATAYDADAAAWLMATGADLEVLNQFLARALEPEQQRLLEQLESSLEVWDVHGQPVAVGTALADEYVDSASVLTHHVVEDLGHRVAIAVVSMPDRTQIVARSRLAEVDVGAAMALIGGGGHAQAASAGFRELPPAEALRAVRTALEQVVHPPLTAADIMSAPVRTVTPETSMRDAAELMGKWGHGGLPVEEAGKLVGLVTRKDVDKALRHRLGHAPVKGFMGGDVVTVARGTDLTELERLLGTRGIGRVPVMDNGHMIGIITRKDVLRAQHGESYVGGAPQRSDEEARRAFLASVDTLLPPQVRDTLRRLGQIAEECGVRAHVVGGFVRDMLLGRENLDIDVVVEGDGIAFGERAAATLGARVTAHRRFGTAVLVLSRDFRIDIASSRSEYYTRPGALPTVERSTLRQDLLRRDFTINAMAACVDASCFGAIADPFGGLGDLKDGTIRVLHALSFVEDPTRVLRAARFEVRYGFALDEHSEALARQAVELDLLDEVSGARVREELYDLLDEAEPVRVLKRVDELGALAPMLPPGGSSASAIAAAESALAGVARLEESVLRLPDRRTALIAALSTSGRRDGVDRWLRHMRIGKAYAQVALSIASAAGVERALADKRGMRDSRLARMLEGFAPEAVAVLWARGDDLARERVEHYALEVAAVRPSVTGRDLIEMGAPPGAAFSAILARARDDRLDGRVAGREAELANLRRLAVKAGLVPARKDRA